MLEIQIAGSTVVSVSNGRLPWEKTEVGIRDLRWFQLYPCATCLRLRSEQRKPA